MDNAKFGVGGEGRRLRGQDPAEHDAREAIRHRLDTRASLPGEPDAAKGLPEVARNHR